MLYIIFYFFFFFFKQKTAYEMRISDWSSDVCSSDLCRAAGDDGRLAKGRHPRPAACAAGRALCRHLGHEADDVDGPLGAADGRDRSEEHTSELQSLMRISYAVFCLKKKKLNIYVTPYYTYISTRPSSYTYNKDNSTCR